MLGTCAVVILMLISSASVSGNARKVVAAIQDRIHTNLDLKIKGSRYFKIFGCGLI